MPPPFRALLSIAAPLLPAVGVVAVWSALLPASGGYFSRDWYPAGLALAALLATTALATGRAVPPTRSARVALAAFGGLVLLAFVSIAWARSPGTAWQAADKLLVVGLGAWTLALVPWTAGRIETLVLGWSGAVAVVCAAELAAATAAADLSPYIEVVRWGAPLGYPNGAAALAFMAALPPLVLSARPDRPVVLRAGALGLAAFLGAYGLLPQSRGSVIGLAAALPVLLLVPFRWHLAARLAVVAALLAAASPRIFAVFEAVADERAAGPAVDRAAVAIVLAAAAAAAVGLLLGVAERRVQTGPRVVRAGRVAAVAALVAALAAGAALGLANRDRISDAARAQWNALSSPGGEFTGPEGDGASRLLSADPIQRYDYWRVAVDGFEEAPVAGLGAGNFAQKYTAERRYEKHASFPHNLVLRILSEGGAVGIALLAGLGAALVAGTLSRAARDTVGGRAAGAASIAMAVYFLAHAEFDWLEEFPVLAGPALAFPLAVGTLHAGERPARRRVPPAAAALVALASAASLLAPYVALRYRERAVDTARTDLRSAYEDLDRAAALDPLGTAAPLTEGFIALRRGDEARARTAFAEALEREESWLARFELGLMAAAEGRRGEALRELGAARSANPLEPVIVETIAAVRDRRRVGVAAANRRLFASPLFNRRRIP